MKELFFLMILGVFPSMFLGEYMECTKSASQAPKLSTKGPSTKLTNFSPMLEDSLELSLDSCSL